jgi:acyl-CoA reductase-like NAD-dependent aldehyde dehydrogenase
MVKSCQIEQQHFGKYEIHFFLFRIVADVLEKNGLPGGVSALCQGGSDVGQRMSDDERIKLVSFTGSTEIGRKVAVTVQGRFGKSLVNLLHFGSKLFC